jgi:plastocyanin
MSRARRLALLATVGALAAPAGAAHAAGFTVTFPTDPESGPYTPGVVEAQPGDTVTFDGAFANHPLEWVYQDFTEQETGTTRTYNFTKPGTYRYFCDFHADMTGTVHVAGNQLGTPDFTVAPAAPAVGAKVTFDASAADPDGSVARYEWDLDGNGTFEVSGTARTVSKVYTKAGGVAVAVRYVDDAHETSAAVTHTVVVGATAPDPGTGGGGGGGTTPAPGTPAAPGGGGGATPVPAAKDTRAPLATLKSAKLKLKGRVVSFAVALDEASSATATLKRGTATLGKATIERLAKGTRTITLTLSKNNAARVPKHGTLKVTLTLVTRDAAGNARTLRRTVALRRSPR